MADGSRRRFSNRCYALPAAADQAKIPHFKAKVGVFAGVDELGKVQAWEELGADAITLDSHAVNRDFKLLETLRKHTACGLQLLVNVNCLAACPFARSHMVALSHASQAGSSRFMVDYCLLLCSQRKACEKVHYIRSNWIRPEDLHVYEQLGYDLFKIAERDAPTETLVRRARAYAERRYEGNLLDLVQSYGYPHALPDRYRGSWRWALRFFFRPLKANPLRFRNLLRLAESEGMLAERPRNPAVYIDNRKLHGFLDFLVQSGCGGKNCGTCRYCDQVAEDVVEMAPEFRRQKVELYNRVLEELDSGRSWGWQ